MCMTPADFILGRVACRTCERAGTSIDDTEFLALAHSLIDDAECGAILLSGGDLDCSRYSIVCGEPFLVLRCKGTAAFVHVPDKGTFQFTACPLSLFDLLNAAWRPDFPLLTPPFSGGAVGYFAYELKNQIEVLPQAACDDLRLPDLFLFWPQHILVHDRRAGVAWRLQMTPVWEQDLPKWLAREADRFAAKNAGPMGTGNDVPKEPRPASCAAHSAVTGSSSPQGPADAPVSNFSREEYLHAVARIRDYIRSGDVYQVNLSQRFCFPFDGDPFSLWTALYRANPAPFYAFIQAGDHQVLSTSMERFLFRRGHCVETRPIKGTRPRGATDEDDQALRIELQTSTKDDAELSMIVDLLRNDLGRVAVPRSVRVAQHKRLEAYQNVYHLVSIVVAKLQEAVTHGELLRATFPGGSITGCPKIRAMEIIDELEPHVRHVYTGSIGYLGWHGNLDLSIAIRTAIVCGGRCYFSVGGGVVYDSSEEDEYEETLHKGQTIFNWFSSNRTEGQP